jgi:hypothetical protein
MKRNTYFFFIIFIFSIIFNFAQAQQDPLVLVNKALDRINTFTEQPFDIKNLNSILIDMAYVDELNMNGKANKNAELVDLIYESYLDHQTIYDEATKKLPKKQKKQLKELFQSILDLEKNGNG